MTAIDASFEKEEAKWIPLIGHFIFDFANIEDYLHQVIQHHIGDTQIEVTDISESLPKRLKLFRKILTETVFTNSAQIERVTTAVEATLELVPTRNLVAHNALSLALYEVDGAYQVSGFQISGKRNKDTYLGFDDLKEKGSRLNELRNTFTEVIMDFYEILHKDRERKAMATLLRNGGQ